MVLGYFALIILSIIELLDVKGAQLLVKDIAVGDELLFCSFLAGVIIFQLIVVYLNLTLVISQIALNTNQEEGNFLRLMVGSE